MRDDFTQQVKETLAKRVGSRCSNLGCRKPTYGPHEEPTKAVNIGVAAHITAAAPGGKRYDPNLSPKERKSIENGIWLCQNCGKLIDSDEQKYSVELLLNWKQEAEQQVSLEIENKGTGLSASPGNSLSRFKKYLDSLSNGPQYYWLDDINESTWYEFELFTTVDEESGQPEKPPSRVLKPILRAIRDSKNQSILIIGEPGARKSTLLEKLAVEAACEAQQDVNSPIPILVRLKDYTAVGERPGIRGLIQAGLESYDPSLDVEAMNQLLQSEQVLLLIDGWNELSDEQAKSKIKTFCRPYSMIVTSRNTGDYWEIKQKFEIQPLSHGDVKHFFNERLPNTERKQLQVLADRVKDFGQTPLMVWMLYSIFKATSSTPETRGQAYYAFTQLYLQRAKEGIDLEEAQLALGQLAFNMMQSLKPNDPTDFALDISEIDARRLLGWSDVQLKKVRNHLLKWQGERSPKISFCHQTLQEYYAAVYLLDILMQHQEWLEKAEEQKYTYLQQKYLNYLKWAEPIALMLGLLSDSEIALAIVKQALDVDLMLGARLAGEVCSNFQEITIASVIEAIKRQQVSPAYEIELLGNTHSKYAVPILLEKLTDEENQDFILKSAFALKELGHQSAVHKLLPLLEDDNELTIIATLFVLGALGNEAIVPSLQQTLKHSNNYVRSAVIEALGELESYIVIPNLQQFLQDPSDEIREKAIKSLGKLRDNSVLPELTKIAVEDPNISLRWAAAKVLGQIDREKTTEELLKVLKGADNYEIHQNAAEALGKIGSETAVDGLIASLESHHADWSAAEALVEIGSRKAVPGLVQALKHSVPCEQAAFALGELGDARTVTDLIDVLYHWWPQTRERAVEALGKIGDVKAVPKLYELYETLQDNSRNELRRKVLIALGKLGDDRIHQDLLEILREQAFGLVYYSNWSQVFEAIEKIGDQAAVQVLVQVLLESKISKYRWKAAEVLGNLGNEAAIDGLLAAATDYNSTVRWKSAEALGKLNNLQVMPRILPLLNPEKDPNIRQVAVQVLGCLEDEAAVTALLEALNDLEPDVRYDAAQSLVRLSSSFKDKSASIALLEASKALGYPWKNKLLNDGFIYQVQVIKENCKFYNYEIWQEAETIQNEKLEKQKGKRGAMMGQLTEGTYITYEVNAEVFQVIEHNDGNVIGKQSVDRQSTGD